MQARQSDSIVRDSIPSNYLGDAGMTPDDSDDNTVGAVKASNSGWKRDAQQCAEEL